MGDNDNQRPGFHKKSFYCPFCNVLTTQAWGNWVLYPQETRENEFMPATCFNCNRKHIWELATQTMIYPRFSTAPLPNDDMPEEVKEIYEEARQIHTLSPRATAALLRVALEKLTTYLDEKDGNLYTRIGNLKKQGLPETVIKSLDIVRITANEGGAHPGQIDLTGADSAEIVSRLFFLVNFIVRRTISEPKQIEADFNALPQNKIEGIENRDKQD